MSLHALFGGLHVESLGALGGLLDGGSGASSVVFFLRHFLHLRHLSDDPLASLADFSALGRTIGGIRDLRLLLLAAVEGGVGALAARAGGLLSVGGHLTG